MLRSSLFVSIVLALGSTACDKAESKPPTVSPKQPLASAPTTPSATTSPPETPLVAAEVGKPAPDFTLKDLDGKDVTLSSFKDKTVVLEWYNPDCPFVVKQHTEGPLKTMASDVAKGGVVWLAINSGAAGKQGHGVERNKASLAEYGLSHPVLLDEDGQVGKAYQARNTPHMFVVAPGGALVYAGAIDNAPLGKTPETGLVNHVAAALADLAAGRPVGVADTKAYGCSVKYAN